MLAIEQSYRIFLGEGLIETLYFKNGIIHLIQEHWERMRLSALALHIPFVYDFGTWRRLLCNAQDKHCYDEGGLRCLLLSCDAERGLSAEAQNAILDIQVFSYERTSAKAMHLCSAPWLRDNCNPIYRHKTIQYLEQIQALRQAHANGYDDALFWDTHNRALETTTANIVSWDGRRFYTPSDDQAIIPGVFRDNFLESLRNIGYEVVYGALDRTLLFDMSSVWACNSLRGLCPIASLDGEAIAFDESMHQDLNRLLDAAS